MGLQARPRHPRRAAGRLLRPRRGRPRARHAGEPVRPGRPRLPAGADRDPGRPRRVRPRPGRLRPPRGSPARPADRAATPAATIDALDGAKRRRCTTTNAAFAQMCAGTGSPGFPSGAARERRHRRAGADQVAVAVRPVDPPHRRPELAVVHAGRHPGRVRRQLAAGTGGPTCRPGTPRCAARRAAGCRPPATPPPRPGRSRPGSRSSRRQNRSISARSSLSVGSTISVPATGNDIVGA